MQTIEIDQKSHFNDDHGYLDDDGHDKTFLLNQGSYFIDPIELKKRHIPTEDLKNQPRPIRKFYKWQNRLIQEFLESENKMEVVDTPIPEEKDCSWFAIRASFATNLMLLVLKIIIVIISGSVTVLASAADSFLDILSGAVVFLTQWLMSKYDPYAYPAGKTRMEPVGIIIFASIMGTSSLEIIIQACQDLATGFQGTPPTITINTFVYTILGLTIGLKLILFLFCTLEYKRNGNTTVEALAQDHLNDVMTNSVGVVAVVLAVSSDSLWFLDPLGGMVIGLWILTSWIQTGLEQARYLTGETASPDFLKKLTYIAFNHSPKIIKVDTIKAYHYGNNYLAEVHVALPEDMSLKEAHDIGESLEIKIEQLDEVERAFVHLDYEWEHAPEHKTLWFHKN